MLYNQDNLQKEIDDAIAHFNSELKMINTGRVNPEMLTTIPVEAYGTTTQLNAVGQVILEDAITAKITVWDKSIIQAVDKAIREANIGGSVAVESDFIRIKFNPMTEENRKEKVKDLNKMLEEFRIRIRQIRQNYMQKVDAMTGVSEDDQKRDKESIQKSIDSGINKLEEISKKKEGEILSI